MPRAGWWGVPAAVALSLGLGGCVTSGGCPGFVSYDTPADAADDAGAVAIGTVVEQAGTAPMFAGTAHVWTVDVARWVKGGGDQHIEVVSTPPQCSGSDMYFGADPFEDAAGRQSVLFLYDEGGQWRTITPGQGIVPAVNDGVPTTWPSTATGAGGK